MSFDPSPAAEALLAARGPLDPGPLDPAVAPRDEAEGIAVQLALARRMGAVPPAGFKIGATAQAMRDYLGVSGPIAGFMPAAGLHESGVSLSYAGFRNPGVECEIGVRLARDFQPGPCTPEQAAEGVAELFAAIEIVENRYPDSPGTPTLIADQMYHAAAVLGEPGEWRRYDLPGFAGRLMVGSETRGQGRARDLLGHPMAALAWLASSREAAAFGGLRAGQVCMLGSVCPPVWLDGPCEVMVQFEYLTQVRVSFTA